MERGRIHEAWNWRAKHFWTGPASVHKKQMGAVPQPPGEAVWQSDARLFQKVSPFFPRSVPLFPPEGS